MWEGLGCVEMMVASSDNGGGRVLGLLCQFVEQN